MPQAVITCKACGSPHLVKDGTIKGIQKWECRSCGKKFVDNSAPPGMKTPAVQIGSAVHMYYEGLSLKAICRRLQQTYHNYPSDSAVYAWINISTYFVVERAKSFHPDVGDVWIVDETKLNIRGCRLSILDVVDKNTCFLLATEVVSSSSVINVRNIIDKAIVKAGKIPKSVISKKFAVYPEKSSPSPGEVNRRLLSETMAGEIERFHSIFLNRTNKMSALKSKNSVTKFADGWLIHYNYFKPQEYLGGKTPAEIARIAYRRKNLDNSTVIVSDHLIF